MSNRRRIPSSIPGVHLRGDTRIGRDCTIEPGVMVTDCAIGDRVHLKAGSVLAGIGAR